jgi:hypothetical protein
VDSLDQLETPDSQDLLDRPVSQDLPDRLDQLDLLGPEDATAAQAPRDLEVLLGRQESQDSLDPAARPVRQEALAQQDRLESALEDLPDHRVGLEVRELLVCLAL